MNDIILNEYKSQYEAYMTMTYLGYVWNHCNNTFVGDYCIHKCINNKGVVMDKFDSSVLHLRLEGFYWNGLNWVYR